MVKKSTMPLKPGRTVVNPDLERGNVVGKKMVITALKCYDLGFLSGPVPVVLALLFCVFVVLLQSCRPDSAL